MALAPVSAANPNAPITTVRTATGQSLSSTATACLDLPALPSRAARIGHIIPTFTNNLLSLGQLCDANCTALFTKQALTVHDRHGTPILHGQRESTGARPGE